MSIAELCVLLRGKNYRPCKSEFDLEEQVAKRLDAAGVSYQRQYVAGPRDRFDFLIEGGIVLELKTQGGAGPLLSQLERYAQYERVTAMFVVTTRASHLVIASVGDIHGKPVGVTHVGWF